METEEWSFHRGFLEGVRDSILGISVILQAQDREKPSTAVDAGEEGFAKQMSTLERRRQQKRREWKTEHLADKRREGTSLIRSRVLQCMALNGGVVWASIVVFHHVLTPLLRLVISFIYDQSKIDEKSADPDSASGLWDRASPFLSITFNGLWILPIFILSRVINAIWFQDVADAAYRLARGRPLLPASPSRLLADVLFSLSVETVFLIQALLVKTLIPIPAIAICFYYLHLCLLYALYSFEYKWFNMGWDVPRRLGAIDVAWPYYLGFGLPLALLSGGAFFPVSFVTSGCIFSVLFPLFIVSASRSSLPPRCGVPLNLFAGSVYCCNKLFCWKRRSRSRS